MKKVLLVLISAVLIASMSGYALAGTVGTSDSITADMDDLENGLIKTEPLSSSVYVKYAVSSESYTVTIPGEVTLTGKGDSVTTGVEVTQVTLVHGRYLNLSVMSEHDWNLVLHDNSNNPNHNSKIPYSMAYTDYSWNAGVASAGKSASTTSGSSSESESTPVILLQVHGNTEVEHMKNELTFTMEDDAPSVGSYYDKLTFTVSVEGSSSP